MRSVAYHIVYRILLYFLPALKFNRNTQRIANGYAKKE
jgi:hypothetical protein